MRENDTYPHRLPEFMVAVVRLSFLSLPLPRNFGGGPGDGYRMTGDGEKKKREWRGGEEKNFGGTRPMQFFPAIFAGMYKVT